MLSALLAVGLLGATAVASLATGAGADTGSGSGAGAVTPTSPALLYQEECGSCHFAFQARFLSRASWSAVLYGLPDHFGENAQVDPQTLAILTAYLLDGASPRSTDGPDGAPLLRITQTHWFLDEHDDMDERKVLRQAGRGGLVNCTACHGQAQQGRFDDDDDDDDDDEEGERDSD